MKRVGNLYEALSTRENLTIAFYQASRGRSRKPEVLDFAENLDQNLGMLSEHLRNETYYMKNNGILNKAEYGIPWLGYIIYPNRIRYGKLQRKRLNRCFRALDGSTTLTDQDKQNRSSALFVAAGHGHDANWRKAMLLRATAWDVPG
jgi:hypothetical protein